MLKYHLTIIDILLFFLVMLTVNFFDFIPFPTTWDSWNSNVNKYAILLISISIWLISLFYTHQGDILNKKNKKSFDSSTIFLTLSLIVVCIFSAIFYSQSLFSTFENMYWYFVFPFLYFGLKDYLIEFGNLVKFDKIIVVTGVLLSVVYLLYSKGFINLHPNAIIDIQNLSSGKVEYGFSRFQAPADFVFFVSFYLSLTLTIEMRELNVKYFIQQILLIANLFFVGQIRVYFVIAFMLFIVTLFFKIVGKFKQTKIIFIIFGFLAGCFLILYLIKKLNFFGGGARQASSIVRSEEISYYLSHMFDHKLFGVGFPDITYNYYLIRGFSPTYLAPVYYLEDVGVFGFLGVFGLLGIIYILLFLNNLVSHIRVSQDKIIMYIFICAFLATCFTLIPLNNSRIELMPFYLIIITILSRSKKNEKYFISSEL